MLNSPSHLGVLSEKAVQRYGKKSVLQNVSPFIFVLATRKVSETPTKV